MTAKVGEASYLKLAHHLSLLRPQHMFPLASRIQKLPRLLVASSNGHLYIYNLDPQDGGECVLIKTHR